MCHFQTEEIELLPSREEEQGVGLGGWARGHVQGAGRVCEGKNRHVNAGECVCGRAWCSRAGGSKVGWGKEPRETVCLCVCVCVCVPLSLCALGVGVCLPVSAFSPVLDF